VHQLDPEQAVDEIQSLEKLLADAVSSPRLVAVLLGAFGVAALVITLAGLAGLVAYSVSLRTREIGIRVALGAERNAIIRMVAGAGLRLTAVGILLGAGFAAAATRGLASMLYGVSPGDPVTLVAIAMLVGIVALLASYVPARRALRIDPVEALRAE